MPLKLNPSLGVLEPPKRRKNKIFVDSAKSMLEIASKIGLAEDERIREKLSVESEKLDSMKSLQETREARRQVKKDKKKQLRNDVKKSIFKKGVKSRSSSKESRGPQKKMAKKR